MAFYLLPVLMGSGLSAAMYAAIFIGGVFASVVAHEFGHAGAAAWYGIKTADITLLPIGGVARLTRLPEKPFQELVIALAGPAVNVVIAGVIFSLLVLGVIVQGGAPALGSEMNLLEQIFAANIFLCVFNLLPAFPMDGGRVLRSLLAMRLGNLRATGIAARVGRWMALGFVVLGFYSWNPMLFLIAAFVFIAGTAELFSVKAREMAQAGGGPVADASFTSGSSFGGGQYATWASRSWPPQGGADFYQDVVHSRDEVIDAVDVKKIR